MARKKVAVQYITNDASRKATFRRRRKGLVKKAHELATLCDVKTCLILYGQNEPDPVVWPSIPEAACILAELKRMPEMDRSKEMMNHEAFTRNQISRMQDQLRKIDRENRELERQTLINDCLMGRKTLDSAVDDEKEMMRIGWAVETKLKDLKRREEEEIKAKEDKGKAVVVTAMEEALKWIPECMTDDPLTGNDNYNMYHDHFALPPLRITDQPTAGSGANHEASNPWMNYFSMN